MVCSIGPSGVYFTSGGVFAIVALTPAVSGTSCKGNFYFDICDRLVDIECMERMTHTYVMEVTLDGCILKSAAK